MTGPAPDPASPAIDPATDRVPARPAATVVILRDGGEGIEAFMVVRHRAIEFAAGALVFPGGKVDPEDADAAWADEGEAAAGRIGEQPPQLGQLAFAPNKGRQLRR